MAITKTFPIKFTLKKAIDYIINPEKTDEKILVSSFGCSPETADIEFGFTYNKSKIKKGDNIARHIVQSFEPNETTPEQAHEIGMKLAEELLGGNYEFVLTTHIDKGHIHNHIIFNNVSFVNKKKYQSNKRTYKNMRCVSDNLCREYGLSVIEPNSNKGKTYKEILEIRNGTSWKAKLKYSIDYCIRMSSTFDEFLKAMQELEYNYKTDKYLYFKAKEQQRFLNAQNLGKNYSENEIKYRIENKSVGKRSKKFNAGNEDVKLITNFNSSYWSKIFNLKQAAKTMNFLTENNITTYDELQNKFSILRRDSKNISDKIKKAEREITEIDLMLKNKKIYAKTKSIYDEYKKTHFNDNFYEENKADLILFESAKKFFEENKNDKTFLKSKELFFELRLLKKEKQSLYEVYYATKDSFKEIETIKKNIDALLTDTKLVDKNLEF